MKVLCYLFSFLITVYGNEKSKSDLSNNENFSTLEYVPLSREEQLFQKLFKQRRAEQVQAVKGLLSLDSYEKQYKMISVIVDKVFSVIQTSRVLLESSGYIPGLSDFPKDESILDALANILENTALFGDIILHLPEISVSILDSNNEWKVMFEWSLNFANQTHFLDKNTRTLIDLVYMELNITERHEGYVNPYRRDYNPTPSFQESSHEPSILKKKRKKKEIKKGPRLSFGEL